MTYLIEVNEAKGMDESMENRGTIEEVNNTNGRNWYLAINGTSFLLYTFLNAFILAYINYNQGLNDLVLGLCIFYNFTYALLLLILIHIYSQRFFLVSLIVYVINICTSFIIIGIIGKNIEPLLFNVVYALIHTIAISIILYKRQSYTNIRTDTYYDAI